MSKQAILKIKEAEAEAQRMRSDAQTEAKRRVREAEAEAKKLLADTEAEARSVNKERLRLTAERAEELIAEGAKNAVADAADVAKACEPFMENAVKVIVEGVFEQCR